MKIDGVPGCDNSARGDNEDTILVFTGPAWNRQSVLCRARQAFFGVIDPMTPVTEASITIDENFDDAIGYCLVNAKSSTEITMVSVCGQRSAGKTACEETLPARQKQIEGLTTKWQDCPGEGSLCPELPEEPCVTEPGDGKSYAAYFDIEALSCGGSGQSDHQDSLLVTSKGGWAYNTAACLAQAPYVWGIDVGASGALSSGMFQPAAAPQIHSEMTEGLVLSGSGVLPVPKVSPLGYCVVYEGEQIEYVIYNFCDRVKAPANARLVDETLPSKWSPEALCAGLTEAGRTLTVAPRTFIEPETDAGAGFLVDSNQNPGRPSRWFSCQGDSPGPLCFQVNAARP